MKLNQLTDGKHREKRERKEIAFIRKPNAASQKTEE
jgi:hypothetical protein